MLTLPKNEGSAAPVIRALCTLRPHSDECRPLQVLVMAGKRLVDCAHNTPSVKSEGAIVRGGAWRSIPAREKAATVPKVSGTDNRRKGD
jgi:hypothetical protein